MRETLSTKKPLVIAVAIFLAILACILVFSIIVAPARQPYRDALAQSKNVDTALARTNISLSPSETDDTKFNANVDALTTRLASLKTGNDALGNFAVLKEGEGKDLYAAYSKDITAYITYITNISSSMKKVRTPLLACSAAMNNITDNTEGAKVFTKCADEYDDLKDIADTDYKTYVESSIDAYRKMADLFTQSAALSDPNGADAAKKAALDQDITNETTELSTISTTFSKNVTASKNAILVTDSAKELNDWLQAKSRVFSF